MPVASSSYLTVFGKSLISYLYLLMKINFYFGMEMIRNVPQDSIVFFIYEYCLRKQAYKNSNIVISYVL